MVTLGILLTKGHRLLSVAAILDMFGSVNRFYESDEQTAPFSLSFISNEDTIPDSYPSLPVKNLQEAGGIDVILIPAFEAKDMKELISQNSHYIPWLQTRYAKGAEIASFCTGTFLLGASGLLNSRAATTHADACLAFKCSFPDVILKPEVIVTADGNLYTSGGATSSFHLMLHLIENYCGRTVAIKAAKHFAIDMDRKQQTYFGTFSPPVHHNDHLVSSLQQRIENKYQQNRTIEDIIKDIPASRRNLVRRFKLMTGITPIEYLQKTRIEAAKKLLEQTDMSILEVMLNSGYNDLKAFRQLFKKNAGLTPTAYREKFNAKKLAV